MKHFVKFFVVTFFLIFCTNVIAKEKIVVLDLKYVLNQSKAGKGAQDYLKKLLSTNQKKYSDMEKNLKKEETDLLTKKTVLSKEEYQKKSDALRKKVIDYQSQRRSAFDSLTTQRAEAKAGLLKALDPIIQTYIKENNISLVVRRESTLAGNPENDITEAIVKKLNKVLPSLNLK